ncbi:hypothetical protein [Herbiconiux sp. YIM B11900]|uniref:hypothetical protein n=1 Tax=Herbiconiux sp. YIM B11900 TaxID=3404131 RepID=UPI003F86F45A
MIERTLLALAVILAAAAVLWGRIEFNPWVTPTGGPFTLIILAIACLGLWALAGRTERSTT